MGTPAARRADQKGQWHDLLATYNFTRKQNKASAYGCNLGAARGIAASIEAIGRMRRAPRGGTIFSTLTLVCADRVFWSCSDSHHRHQAQDSSPARGLVTGHSCHPLFGQLVDGERAPPRCRKRFQGFMKRRHRPFPWRRGCGGARKARIPGPPHLGGGRSRLPPRA
jgi:hypothetical protein